MSSSRSRVGGWVVHLDRSEMEADSIPSKRATLTWYMPPSSRTARTTIGITSAVDATRKTPRAQRLEQKEACLDRAEAEAYECGFWRGGQWPAARRILDDAV
jgi:hypothetical protein